MPLEHILRAMQAQADADIEKIACAAEQEAAQLIGEAEAQATAIRARHRARVEPMLVTQVASLQNKSKLGALRATANAREELLTDAFTRAEARLEEIHGSEQYAAIFRVLARQAAREVDTEARVRVDPRDAALARAAFAELRVRAEIETRTIPLGGLEVTTRDGRVVIVNTLAARLERARTLLRGPVARILVGQEKSEKEWTTSTATPTPA